MRVEAFIDRYRGDLFLFNKRFPGGFTPRFGADIRDMSLVGGLRGERDNGLKWDASVSAARSTIEFFIFSTINASLGPATPTSFRPRDYIQTEVAANLDAGPPSDGRAPATSPPHVVESPADVFKWIDTHIRPPNKVLITTRSRAFAGDYPITIGGMTDEQAHSLVDQHAAQLSVAALLDSAYKKKLIQETDGHPYVIKILLGQVAKERRAVTPRRIVAGSHDLLRALFERTYRDLSPGGQRVFLLLCSWRVFVPEVAVEAVSLRPGTQRFDVAEALEELRRFSLVDQIFSNKEEDAFVGVPLAAAMYGRSKLEVSPFKVAVEEDRKILMEFGAGKQGDVERGVLPRIENLVRAVAIRASSNPETLEERLPVLEYLATKTPKAYLRLADLVLEVDNSGHSTNQAKEYVRNYLERAPIPDRQSAWLRLADLCQSSQDPVGEVHALSEAALLSTSDMDNLGGCANRLNNRIRDRVVAVRMPGPERFENFLIELSEQWRTV